MKGKLVTVIALLVIYLIAKNLPHNKYKSHSEADLDYLDDLMKRLINAANQSSKLPPELCRK